MRSIAGFTCLSAEILKVTYMSGGPEETNPSSSSNRLSELFFLGLEGSASTPSACLFTPPLKFEIQQGFLN
jgi:hypothetical protein